ncbi:unnamed protein product, partial [Dicrocoelium dendriticum]
MARSKITRWRNRFSFFVTRSRNAKKCSGENLANILKGDVNDGLMNSGLQVLATDGNKFNKNPHSPILTRHRGTLHKFNYHRNVNSSLNFTKDSLLDSMSFHSLPSSKQIGLASQLMLHASEECKHCAARGLDIVARDSRVFRGINANQLCTFSASPRSGCEFRFSFTFFLKHSSGYTEDALSELPLILSTMLPNFPERTRIR